jgi:hypothetical protein
MISLFMVASPFAFVPFCLLKGYAAFFTFSTLSDYTSPCDTLFYTGKLEKEKRIEAGLSRLTEDEKEKKGSGPLKGTNSGEAVGETD